MANFCKNCGTELKDSNVCSNCGTVNGEQKNNTTVNTQTVQNQTKKKSNGLAIAGFVVSLVSLVCCSPLSFVSLVLSIIGLVNANKDPEKTGKSHAIAGLIISIVTIVLVIVLWSLGLLGTIMDTVTNDLNSTYYN